ncbi:hypothetical protein [Sphingomonas endolithica]|jgi:hypothetical protein|uniref:hypothetical protein n=1 Tax=Sphingomonas endolithica TaxID=2972485 RepID=UPI0021AE4F4B|nr:hypothetical protein [Sphingomonas sp. ZFBP2030]
MAMATNASEISGKMAKSGSKFAGRSAVTGGFVLKPVSRQGRLTLERARAIVRQINERK